MPLRHFLRLTLFCFAASFAMAETAPSREKFAGSGGAKVLLIGGGSSHDFEKWFHQADAATLKGAGYDVAYTAQVEEALALLPQADALVLSTNQKEFGVAAFQVA